MENDNNSNLTIESILENQLKNSNSPFQIFKNEKYLSKNYFPISIEFREKEFHQLASFFNEIYNFKRKSLNFFQTVTLFGPVGSGKSTVAKIFGREIENISKTGNFKFRVIYRHINCRLNNTIFLILFDLMRSLIPNFPNRGFSSLELINMLHIVLNNSNSYLILALDEIDNIFYDKELDLFFQNLSMESFDNNFSLERRISLIFITRNKDFLLLVDPNNKFGIINNLIKFEKYSKDDLKKILFNKANESFKEGVLALTTLDFLVEIAEEFGDLRKSIELLWRAGKVSDLVFSPIIDNNSVKKALKMILFSNPELKFEFNDFQIGILQCLAENKDVFKLNQQINLPKLKKIMLKRISLNDNEKNIELSVFNDFIANFARLKIIEQDSTVKSEKNTEKHPGYFLKISPSLILKCL